MIMQLHSKDNLPSVSVCCWQDRVENIHRTHPQKNFFKKLLRLLEKLLKNLKHILKVKCRVDFVSAHLQNLTGQNSPTFLDHSGNTITRRYRT